MLTKEEPAYNQINLDEILAPTNVRRTEHNTIIQPDIFI